VVCADVRDSIESTSAPARLELSEWKSTANEAESASTGRYRIAQIEAQMLDYVGRLCTSASQIVSVSLEGEGTILGIENGDLADCSEYNAHRRRLRKGRLIVYVLLSVCAESETKEQVTLTASVEGLSPAAISLRGYKTPLQ